MLHSCTSNPIYYFLPCFQADKLQVSFFFGSCCCDLTLIESLAATISILLEVVGPEVVGAMTALTAALQLVTGQLHSMTLVDRSLTSPPEFIPVAIPVPDGEVQCRHNGGGTTPLEFASGWF